jgi:hypothetical protein
VRGSLFVVFLFLAAVFPAAAPAADQTQPQFSDSQDVVVVEVPDLVGKPQMFDRVADPLRLVLDSGGFGGGKWLTIREAPQPGEPGEQVPFQAPRLAPGEYLLRVTLTGPGGGAESSITPFRVPGL